MKNDSNQYQDRRGREITKDVFLQLRDNDVLIYGNAFFEKNGNIFRLLNPATITMVHCVSK